MSGRVVLVTLWASFACGVAAVDLPPSPPRSRLECELILERYCDDCHRERCAGWTVYEGVCGLERCLDELERCPPDWPPECKGALDPRAINDCDA